MSDNYQAIYDAVRSRIYGFDASRLVEAIAQQFDVSWQKQHLEQEIYAVSHEMQRPSVLFRPSIGLDGTKWCALYGEDLMNGVAGFGDTPEEAMREFDKNWQMAKVPRVSANG